MQMKPSTILIASSLFFFFMFLYSGFDKIFNFRDKIKSLDNKLSKYIKLPKSVLKLGMILVILLEIAGPIIIFIRMIFCCCLVSYIKYYYKLYCKFYLTFLSLH